MEDSLTTLGNTSRWRKETCRINIICFNDSNTYGYAPRDYLDGRYDVDSRWVDILATATGWTISNMGQNGPEIPLPLLLSQMTLTC